MASTQGTYMGTSPAVCFPPVAHFWPVSAVSQHQLGTSELQQPAESLELMTRYPVLWFAIASLVCGCGASTGLLGDGEREVPEGGAAGDGSGVNASGGAINGGSAALGNGGAMASSGANSLGSNGGTSSTGSAGGVASATGGNVAAPVSAEQLNAATSVCGATPWIFSGLVPNARGLGGVPLVKGAVTCGRLYRGSQLATLGVNGCVEFASLGIRSVIDLRTASEAARAPSPSCVINQARQVAAPMPTPYNLSPADYSADLHAHDSLLAAFAVLGDASAYPVYFHCIYGRDRTAILAALILRLLGASREVVMTEYMRTAESGLGTAPQSLQATLDEIELLGGAEAFLLSIGVSTEAIAVLRAQAIAN